MQLVCLHRYIVVAVSARDGP